MSGEALRRSRDDDAYDRSFGRYLDDDVTQLPHTPDEADHERLTRGQGTADDEHASCTTHR